MGNHHRDDEIIELPKIVRHCRTNSSSVRPKYYPHFIHEALSQYFEVRLQQSWKGRHILSSKCPDENALFFTSNDYLQLSQHPELLNAEINALKKYGNGLMQSPVFLTEDSLLKQTEASFSAFIHYPACLLSQSGWCANIGLIQALAKPNLPVYLDLYAHMSFWEGIKCAGAKPIPFKHNHIGSLKKRLERYGSGIIAVDSIYSTLGTISPIADYVKLAKQYDCLLIVDESHALGAFGKAGSGLVAQLGLSNQVDLITASLAKAFSGRGGLIAGDKTLIEFIRFTAYPSIFSSTLLPHDLIGFQATIDLMRREPWRAQQLHNNALFLRNALNEIKCYFPQSDSQIIPLMTHTEDATIWLRDELEKKDIFGSIFCAPATPKNGALIRLSINTHHTRKDLTRVVDCLRQLKKNAPALALFNPDPINFV